ncbi:MAG: hypothetical protein M1812_000596 [Candelaria pacifica]|nr:MAG: hypothetical protein M1812_000596 [Candelaria pacifica]
MMRRNDPRIRQRLNQISQNLESANESAQANLFSFSQNYVNPCLFSVNSCVNTCTTSCFPSRDDRLRRSRSRPRGRAELNFDFYDDWDDDDAAGDGLLGWGNDELDRLLAGSGTRCEAEQPGRQRAMSYGARGDMTGKRKGGVLPHDGGPDPTVIPKNSMFGFLERLPWKIGGRGVRYRPSAADLQEHPGRLKQDRAEDQPLIEDSDEDDGRRRRKNQNRVRSSTVNSQSTANSLSSRGDLFPSEDEDDAVPLDDEFAIGLERRPTNSTDDTGSRKTRSKKRPSGSRTSLRTHSSKETKSSGKRDRESSASSIPQVTEADLEESPTITDLKQEEEQVRDEEDAEVERKRLAAQRLATERGLSATEENKVAEQAKEISSSANTQQPSITTEPVSESPTSTPSPSQLQDTHDDAFHPARLPHFSPPSPTEPKSERVKPPDDTDP